MAASGAPPPDEHHPSKVATQHITDAHQLLNALRERVGHHPELQEAILKLELALNALAVRTGGML